MQNGAVFPLKGWKFLSISILCLLLFGVTMVHQNGMISHLRNFLDRRPLSKSFCHSYYKGNFDFLETTTEGI